MPLFRKSMMVLSVLGTLMCVAASAQAQGDGDSGRRFRVGPQVGTFFPTSSRTRDTFGDNWFELGVGFGKIQDAEEAAKKGRIAFGMNVISTSEGRNKATLIPIGVGYRKTLSSGSIAPYAGVSANLLFTTMRVPAEGINSGLRAGTGASAVLGAAISRNAFIETQYYLFSKVRGYDFSGLELKAGLRF